MHLSTLLFSISLASLLFLFQVGSGFVLGRLGRQVSFNRILENSFASPLQVHYENCKLIQVRTPGKWMALRAYSGDIIQDDEDGFEDEDEDEDDASNESNPQDETMQFPFEHLLSGGGEVAFNKNRFGGPEQSTEDMERAERLLGFNSSAYLETIDPWEKIDMLTKLRGNKMSPERYAGLIETARERFVHLLTTHLVDDPETLEEYLALLPEAVEKVKAKEPLPPASELSPLDEMLRDREITAEQYEILLQMDEEEMDALIARDEEEEQAKAERARLLE